MTHPTNTAEVRAHDRVMRYERSGTGQPLLLLGADQPGDLWPELAGLLAGHFRVLVPDIPPGVDAAEWLECFLDGLGVQHASAVAGGRLRDVALDLATGASEFVTRVVLVTPGSGAAEPPGTYVLPRGITVADAVERIRGYLG